MTSPATGDPATEDGAHPAASAPSARASPSAAQKSGIGQLADGETPTGAALLGALGGVRGLAETILPGLVFLILFTFTQNVPLSIGCSVLSPSSSPWSA